MSGSSRARCSYRTPASSARWNPKPGHCQPDNLARATRQDRALGWLSRRSRARTRAHSMCEPGRFRRSRGLLGRSKPSRVPLFLQLQTSDVTLAQQSDVANQLVSISYSAGMRAPCATSDTRISSLAPPPAVSRSRSMSVRPPARLRSSNLASENRIVVFPVLGATFPHRDHTVS